jgi:hypothetical protein
MEASPARFAPEALVSRGICSTMKALDLARRDG